MQNNGINVSSRIMCTLLLCLSIFFANSIYLIIFLSILCLIFIILTDKSVKEYIYLIKKFKFWLLFIFITYIMFFRNILNSLILCYKFILILFTLKQFSLTVNFESLNDGINSLLKRIIKNNSSKISYNVTLILYFIKFYINTPDKTNNLYYENKWSFKKYIIPKIYMVINKLTKLENALRLKCYKSKVESFSLKSIILEYLYLLLFIVVIFKEVIL